MWYTCMPSTCWQSFTVYIAEPWGVISVPVLYHGHVRKAAEIWAEQCLSKLGNDITYDA